MGPNLHGLASAGAGSAAIGAVFLSKSGKALLARGLEGTTGATACVKHREAGALEATPLLKGSCYADREYVK
jgi:hypothetical protein